MHSRATHTETLTKMTLHTRIKDATAVLWAGCRSHTLLCLLNEPRCGNRRTGGVVHPGGGRFAFVADPQYELQQARRGRSPFALQHGVCEEADVDRLAGLLWLWLVRLPRRERPQAGLTAVLPKRSASQAVSTVSASRLRRRDGSPAVSVMISCAAVNGGGSLAAYQHHSQDRRLGQW
jgi:hypothetical protein